jgi:hypothetical protein
MVKAMISFRAYNVAIIEHSHASARCDLTNTGNHDF